MACSSALVHRAAMRVKSVGPGQLCRVSRWVGQDSQATGANLRRYSRSCPPLPSPWFRLDWSARTGMIMMGTATAKPKAVMVGMRSHRGLQALFLGAEDVGAADSRSGDSEGCRRDCRSTCTKGCILSVQSALAAMVCRFRCSSGWRHLLFTLSSQSRRLRINRPRTLLPQL